MGTNVRKVVEVAHAAETLQMEALDACVKHQEACEAEFQILNAAARKIAKERPGCAVDPMEDPRVAAANDRLQSAFQDTQNATTLMEERAAESQRAEHGLKRFLEVHGKEEQDAMRELAASASVHTDGSPEAVLEGLRMALQTKVTEAEEAAVKVRELNAKLFDMQEGLLTLRMNARKMRRDAQRKAEREVSKQRLEERIKENTAQAKALEDVVADLKSELESAMDVAAKAAQHDGEGEALRDANDELYDAQQEFVAHVAKLRRGLVPPDEIEAYDQKRTKLKEDVEELERKQVSAKERLTAWRNHADSTAAAVRVKRKAVMDIHTELRDVQGELLMLQKRLRITRKDPKEVQQMDGDVDEVEDLVQAIEDETLAAKGALDVHLTAMKEAREEAEAYEKWLVQTRRLEEEAREKARKEVSERKVPGCVFATEYVDEARGRDQDAYIREYGSLCRVSARFSMSDFHTHPC